MAPGIDVERDILAQMAFRPHRSATPEADGRAHLSGPSRWTCEAALLDLQLADRISYDAERNTLFANFEGLRDPQRARTSRACAACSRRCASGIGHKVALVVNYDGFRLDEALADAYFEMVSELQATLLQHRRRATPPAPSCA